MGTSHFVKLEEFINPLEPAPAGPLKHFECRACALGTALFAPRHRNMSPLGGKICVFACAWHQEVKSTKSMTEGYIKKLQKAAPYSSSSIGQYRLWTCNPRPAICLYKKNKQKRVHQPNALSQSIY